MSSLSTQVFKLPKGIVLCECSQYQSSGTCRHINPKANQHPGSGNPKQTPKPNLVVHSTSFDKAQDGPKGKALRFQELLKSQGIESELKVSSNNFFQQGSSDTYMVFYRKKGWKGYTYSYVKIFSNCS
jgi:hypothetical protein